MHELPSRGAGFRVQTTVERTASYGTVKERLTLRALVLTVKYTNLGGLHVQLAPAGADDVQKNKRSFVSSLLA